MMRHLLCKSNQHGISIIFRVIVMPVFFSCFFSCGGEKKEFVDLGSRDQVYMMKVTDWSTLVSDSGITRYKIEAEEFYIYDEPESYWYFPEKIHLEMFDTLMRVEASVDADTAYYFNNADLWKAIGNVVIESLEGERFETSELFWDRKKEELYSDKYIKITKGDFINTGVGFRSNQSLTQYQIFQSGAEIPFTERVADTTSTENMPIP